jgi:hypothetical protein
MEDNMRDYQVIMGNIGNALMNTVAMGLNYEGWSDEFSYEEVRERYESLIEQMKDILKEDIGDITKLPASELKKMGFKRWTDEEPELKDLLLIPLWVLILIPDGTVLTSISGDRVIKGRDDFDTDVRFGCIPFGIMKEDN